MTLIQKAAAACGWSVAIGAVIYLFGAVTHRTWNYEEWNGLIRLLFVILWCLSSLSAGGAVLEREGER